MATSVALSVLLLSVRQVDSLSNVSQQNCKREERRIPWNQKSWVFFIVLYMVEKGNPFLPLLNELPKKIINN
jgi:hypothetical protein